jgi:hypothetical protein
MNAPGIMSIKPRLVAMTTIQAPTVTATRSAPAIQNGLVPGCCDPESHADCSAMGSD